MRRISALSLTLLLSGLLSLPALADETLAEADALYKQGGVANIKKSLPLYDKAVAANPNSYEALWKAARAYRDHASKSMEVNAKGWKDVCKRDGKKALQLADKAVKLEPKKIEGNFWYGCAAGTYADGVSIITAVSEGLADKTKKGFETAYKIDKRFETGGPIKALGRYWSVLPWPLKDGKKGLKYLEEYSRLFPDNAEGQVYYAEALLDRDDDGDKAKAKAVLQKTLQAKNKFYRNWAQRLITENKL